MSSHGSENNSVYRNSDLAYGVLVPPRHEGVSRSSRHVRRGAVDVKALTDERRFRGRRNRVVLAPQGPALKFAMMLAHHAGDGGKRDGSPRRARISRKPLRREGRCDHRLCLWFSRSRKFFLREGPGCSGHPVFPAPSAFSRVIIGKARAKRAARRRLHVLSVSCPAKAGHPVFQRPLSKNSGVSGILDRPACRAMTAAGMVV